VVGNLFWFLLGYHLPSATLRIHRGGAEYAEKNFFVKKYSDLRELCVSAVNIDLDFSICMG
jgi:hypothetical protein